MRNRLILALLLISVPPMAAGSDWGYGPANGPSHWVALDTANVLCAKGRAQSPVDLRGALEVNGPELEHELGPSDLDFGVHAHVMDLIDNGHTIQVTSDAAISVDIDDVRYKPVQFHFHSPSEHTIAGKHWPLEAHFVMTSKEGALTVIGVLYEAGAPNSAIDPVLRALPEKTGDRRHLEGLDLDLAELIPTPDRYFRYSGSLTTPPCSEGVTWIILPEPQTLGESQLDSITRHLHENARPTQPLNERDLILVGPAD